MSQSLLVGNGFGRSGFHPVSGFHRAGHAGPARHAGSAHRVCLRRLFGAVCAAALAGGLTACGGGSGDSTTPPPSSSPTPSSPPAGPLAAVMTVPTPTDYDADRLAAFNRLNEIRLSAGLGMVASNPMLDQAAQAHAEWMVTNGVYSHEETAGTPGFTGVEWWDRDLAAGYTTRGGDELITAGYEPTSGIDALVNGIYHREGILEVYPVDVGIGFSRPGSSPIPTPMVIDITAPSNDTARRYGQMTQSGLNGIVIWPLDGAINVPTLMGNEAPNPVDSVDVKTLGTPASINVDSSRSISVNRFVMVDVGSNSNIDTVYIDRATDPHALTPQSFVGIVPKQKLLPNATYEVQFSGSISGSPVTKTWRFTTGGN